MRGVYVVAVTLCTLYYLLPLKVGMGYWPGPDLIVAIAFVWVMRRPDFMPVWLAAPIFLLADFIFQRPPGLWAALCVVGLEFLRGRERTSRDMPLMVEWLMVAGVLLGMAVVYRMLLAIFLVDLASLGLVILGQLSTLIAYPFVALISSSLLGIRKLTPTEADELMRQG